MLETNYGEDIDSPIACPSHVVHKLKQVENCNDDCKECWIGVLNKVKFREDVL